MRPHSPRALARRLGQLQHRLERYVASARPVLILLDAHGAHQAEHIFQAREDLHDPRPALDRQPSYRDAASESTFAKPASAAYSKSDLAITFAEGVTHLIVGCLFRFVKRNYACLSSKVQIGCGFMAFITKQVLDAGHRGGRLPVMSWCLSGSEMLDMTWWFDPTDLLHHFFCKSA